MADTSGTSGHHPNYKKIYYTLLVLLVISVAGPFLGIFWVTLLTAFGIAIVKAYLVAANFMHLNIEKKYISYMLGTMLMFMLLFFAGTAPDVMKHKGQNWENVAAEAEIERALEAQGMDPHDAKEEAEH